MSVDGYVRLLERADDRVTDEIIWMAAEDEAIDEVAFQQLMSIAYPRYQPADLTDLGL